MKWVGRGIIFDVGNLQEVGKRAQRLFCRHRIKSDNLEHEYGLGTFLDLYPDADVIQHTRLPYRCDALVRFSYPTGVIETLHVEYDNSTEKADELRQKVEAYKSLKTYEYAVFVMQSKSRKDLVLRLAKDCPALRACTLEDALKEPYGWILTDPAGDRDRMRGEGNVVEEGGEEG